MERKKKYIIWRSWVTSGMNPTRENTRGRLGRGKCMVGVHRQEKRGVASGIVSIG